MFYLTLKLSINIGAIWGAPQYNQWENSVVLYLKNTCEVVCYTMQSRLHSFIKINTTELS